MAKEDQVEQSGKRAIMEIDPKEKSKDETYFKICNAVLKLEVTRGHLNWSISQVSRTSGVTRSLIYYYFGKEKEAILKEASLFMLEIFYHLSKEDEALDYLGRMKSLLVKTEKMPYCFIFYCNEKSKNSEIGTIIRDHEKKAVERIKNENNISENEALKKYLVSLGAIAYGNLTEDKLNQLFS